MEETIARLQQLIEISPEKLAAFEKERKQTRRFNSVPLLTQLTDDEVAKFSVNQHKLPGVSVTANLKRYYPYGEVLTHVIGYVSRINDKDLERLDKEGKKANYQATEISANSGLNATMKTYCTVPPVIRKSKSTAVAVSFAPLNTSHPFREKISCSISISNFSSMPTSCSKVAALDCRS